MAADSRFSQKSWCALSILNVSGGGNLSTDSPLRRQKRFQSALRKLQSFTGSLWAGTLSLGGDIREGRCCDRGNLPRTRVSGSRLFRRNLRKPSPGWCRRSIGERRNLVFPLGHTTVQVCWMLPRTPGFHRQEMFCCNPS